MSALTLDQAVTLFLGDYDNPGTLKAYRSALAPMIAALGSSRLIDDITAVELVEYAQQLQQSHLAAATQRKHIKSIKAFFSRMIQLDVIGVNPAAAIKAKRLPTYVSRDKAMTDDELSRVLDYAKWKPREYALVLFLADTGCRAAGAAGLRLVDLDLDAMTALVTEKGSKSRYVAFGATCAAALQQWLTSRPDGAGAYVFSRSASALTPYTVGEIIRRLCLKVGIRSLGSHSLRHRKAHQLADNRVAASVAATALGHSSPTITLQYYYPADWDSAQKALRSVAVGGVSGEIPQVEKIIPFPKRRAE